MSLFRASRISSRGLIPTTADGGGGDTGVVAGAGVTVPAGTSSTGVGFVGAAADVPGSLGRWVASPSAGIAGGCWTGSGCGGCLGGGGGGDSSGPGSDALHVPAARAILSADFLASPGVGTGVEQMSAALPQLLAGASVQSAAVVRWIRNGGTGHWSGAAGADAAGCSSRRGGATGAGPSGGGAEIAVRDGGGIDHGADAIRLAVSESRPLGI